MSVRLETFGLENYYKTLSGTTLLNDLELTDNNLKNMIYTTTDGATSLIPKCDCGYLHNGYKLNHICPLCGSVVARPFDNINPILWVDAYTEDAPFISPKFWTMLSRIISTKVQALLWLADSTNRQQKIPIVLHNLAELIGGRGYVNVINNIPKIITYLRTLSTNKKFTRMFKLKRLMRMYKQNRAILLSTKLPLINRRLFVSETSKDSSYNNAVLADVIDIAVLAVTTAKEPDPDVEFLHNNTAKLVNSSAKLFREYVHSMVGQKGGLARQHIYARRSHFTFRAVISILPIDYTYDELHVPWLVGVVAFRPHLMSKLMNNYGYTLKKASALLFKVTRVYDSFIAKLLQELIDESPSKGIPVLFNRNPTQGPASILRLNITKFHDDLKIKTMFMSAMIVSLLNADSTCISITRKLVKILQFAHLPR